MTTVRANVYESDPLTTFVERIGADNEWSDYYELPEPMIAAYESAEKALTEAREAVERHIADNRLTRHEGVL
jgi:hypothetical protein